ncbi:MAG: cyanophycinase [Phormidesmis priestleyi]|uniref:Cyanophycinase n=1 Tax=Phormidesmis priestleyi TaxID=268141 RepID=A0A2W4X2Y1_9CYAN|nr:MAG: cyanophycinase [Phormidesmis priestleyi]
MTLNEHNGQLIIIGGAEDRKEDCQILREFIRCAGGLKAKIIVMTVATELPREVGDDYIRAFERLGVEDVRILDTVYRDDASSDRSLEAIQKATGVFFTGGDQARIVDSLKGTEIDKLLHQRFAEGLVIAGTSAGAAMMPDMMIVEGDAGTNPKVNSVETGPGMGFLPGIAIDQHFAQRGRIGRLLSAMAQQSTGLGFGIDENTAVIVDGNLVKVVGEGAVTVVDMANLSHSNLSEILRDEDLALCGVRLHILPDGYGFDLDTRTPIVKGAAISPSDSHSDAAIHISKAGKAHSSKVRPKPLSA